MKLINFLLVAGASALPLWQSSMEEAATTSNVFWFLPNVPITRVFTVFGQDFRTKQEISSTSLFSQTPKVPVPGNSGLSIVASTYLPRRGVAAANEKRSPDYKARAINVYPGDAITSTFTVDGNSVWTDSWSLQPGPAGSAAGQTPQSGSTSQNFADRGALIRALLAIELQQNGQWDFGTVQWNNIAVTASTTAGWCSTGYAVTPSFQYSISGGTQQTIGGSTTCSYPSVTFRGP
ncbi:hypothetical protein BJ875DRAFT_436897 [Amylocarpus encephaloides]|uniref:Uncharacterized protein n=1 Tax=Amylocarpus encephaloides TaxID=45428 RepID=A0A9P7YTT1_9HELO|nr:hypothetical protein BJ875DRAFT_436897 [Amylocarpus encephaloides]